MGALKILEVNYSLRIEDEDREAARRRHALSNRKFLESLERERVGAELAFIRQVVLQDPASAEIYKFLQLSKGGAEAAYGEIYDRLAVLCSEWSPDGQWVLLARVLHEFLTELPPAAKEDLLVIIQACMEASGRLDLVDKVRAVVDRVDS
ncbi:hypothetical protein [Micromonospora zamorensis]|uniref:hypothetical protein n=1 Tax=Micromonospora zamorensis TaxID=709883 RepID=UPI0033BAA13B